MKRIEERYISLLTDEDSLKAYRDVKNSIDTALEKGREEGKNSMAIQIAKKMLDAGMDMEKVMQITDLSKSEIEKLKWQIFIHTWIDKLSPKCLFCTEGEDVDILESIMQFS